MIDYKIRKCTPSASPTLLVTLLLLWVMGTFHWLITKRSKANLTILASLHDLLAFSMVLGLLLVIAGYKLRIACEWGKTA